MLVWVRVPPSAPTIAAPPGFTPVELSSFSDIRHCTAQRRQTTVERIPLILKKKRAKEPLMFPTNGLKFLANDQSPATTRVQRGLARNPTRCGLLTQNSESP
jgi:hypothetical protein